MPILLPTQPNNVKFHKYVLFRLKFCLMSYYLVRSSLHFSSISSTGESKFTVLNILPISCIASDIQKVPVTYVDLVQASRLVLIRVVLRGIILVNRRTIDHTCTRPAYWRTQLKSTLGRSSAHIHILSPTLVWCVRTSVFVFQRALSLSAVALLCATRPLELSPILAGTLREVLRSMLKLDVFAWATASNMWTIFLACVHQYPQRLSKSPFIFTGCERIATPDRLALPLLHPR